MSAGDLDAVAVGDTVRVSAWGGRATDGTVVKIGRTLVHIADQHRQVTTYRRDGHGRRDGYSGGFRTLARVADDERQAEATRQLRLHGIEFRLGAAVKWSTAQLVELAEAAGRIQGADA